MKTTHKQNQTFPEEERELDELKAELEEARETLRAIRQGEVDAVIAATPEGDRVFTLRGAETPYRVIVENISEGAATLLPDGLILYANAAFAGILHAPLSRIIGVRFQEFVWDLDRALLPALFGKALQETVRQEIDCLREGGRIRVQLSLRRLPLDEGRTGLSVVMTDISEWKRAEEELRRAHDELDLRVNQRTRELNEANASLKSEIIERRRAEAGLKKAVSELERSNRELQQFAYVASHDLQEPLRTVASYVDLLAMKYTGKLDEKADRYIAFAVEGATRMSMLINDLLAYSRVGTQGTEFSTVNLSLVLQKALANLATTIRKSGAVVTHEQLPVVRGDETQLIQLFQNMIANAIKFRRKDTLPRIAIRAAREQDKWTVGVQDNGIGIDAAFHERIFTIFQRLHTKDEYPGTGVGLAICRRIVERHGGRIWVESRPGEGSTFSFTLPVSQSDSSTAGNAKE